MTPDAIFLSVRPYYAEKILRHEKSIELRRVRPKVCRGDVVVMYVSSPQREVRAFLLVEEIFEAPPADLWAAVGPKTGVTKQEYDAYFNGASQGVGISIRIAYALEKPLSLDDLRGIAPDFRPPQSFRYVDGLAVGIQEILRSIWAACTRELGVSC